MLGTGSRNLLAPRTNTYLAKTASINLATGASCFGNQGNWLLTRGAGGRCHASLPVK